MTSQQIKANQLLQVNRIWEGNTVTHHSCVNSLWQAGMQESFMMY